MNNTFSPSSSRQKSAGKSPPLPRLPFGDFRALRHTDARSLGEQVARAFPGLNGYDPQAHSSGLFAKTCAIDFPSLKLVTSAIASSVVDRDGRQQMTLMVPLAGRATVTVDGKAYHWGAGEAAIFIPELDGRVLGTGDTRTLVMFQPQRDILERTARAMTGLDPGASIDLQYDRPRTLALAHGSRHMSQILTQLGGIFDLFDCNATALHQHAYQDVLYRYALALLSPDLLSKHEQTDCATGTSEKVVTRLCDEMLGKLDHPFTVSELALRSGYSVRSVQYAFKARFGCGPLSWLREQRLLAARRRLLTGDYDSMMQVAEQLGFGNASLFATAYKTRFGEAPSQTARTSRR